MKKTATTSYPIHELLAERWSPRAFDDRPVDAETLGSLFEAARWAASCFNEQPWHYLVATREDAASFESLAGSLVDGNAWAKQAPVLVLAVASTRFARNDKPNRHALHDLGLATGNLSVQAQSMGLVLHQMGGFDPEAARAAAEIPEHFDPVAMIAIGYPGDAASLPDDLRERERAPRERKSLGSFVFGAKWGEAPASPLADS